MIGTTKLNELRTDLRAAFGRSDKQLLAWFDREIKAAQAERTACTAGTEVLRGLKRFLLDGGKSRKSAKRERRKQAVKRRRARS